MDPKLQAELEEINRLAIQIRKEVDEMKKAFSVFGKWTRPTPEELVEQGHTWKQWYAWRPVKDIHGCWHWRENVYRLLGNTYMDHDSANWYHYGTMFDVIRTTGNG